MSFDSELQANEAVCLNCGRHNKAGSAFCAECGSSLLNGSDESGSEASDEDSQSTVAFVPVRDPGTVDHMSSWAPSGRSGVPAGRHDATSTGVQPLDLPSNPTQNIAEASGKHVGHDSSMRGFFLGMLGMLLFLTVLMVYIYAAWLDDSARETIDSWLPWMVLSAELRS